MNQTAAIFIISFLILGLIVAIPHTEAKSAKDSKARRDIDKSIGRAVEGKFSGVKTVNISTYTAPNESITVYNKTSPGSVLPSPIVPSPSPPVVCNRSDHLQNGTCVPDSNTPVSGYKVCMVGDFKDAKVFDAMKSCDYKVAIGDLGYGSDLKLVKSIAPDRCVPGNHDSQEDGSPEIEKEALAYCGNSWWVKFGSATLMLGFNTNPTNGDMEKQLNAAKDLLYDKNFMSGVKNVIAVSHKGGHTFPNAHHPAEAKAFFAELEGNIPTGVKLYESSAHNHNAAAAPAKGWYISGNGGKGFYQCGNDKDWTFCDSKHLAYLQFNIDDNATITGHFIGTDGKTLY